MTEPEKSKNQPAVGEPVDPAVLSLRKEKDWIIVVDDISNQKCYYEKKELSTSLRAGILEGKHQKSSTVVTHSKEKEGKWNQTTSTLFDFAKSNFKLRTLYQPVWGHAMAGLKWGAIIGVFLKLLDTFFLLLAVETTMAFLFAGAVAVCFIPRIGWLGIIAISFFMVKLGRGNFFLMALAAALAGAILGCLPGMAVGGVIGLIRRNSLQSANDASPESKFIFVKAVLLPLIFGSALIAFYFFVFNPWLLDVLD